MSLIASLPEEFVVPDYGGRTIANIPATAAALLDAPFRGLPPLYEELWRPAAGRARRVVVLLIDSLGWDLLQRTRPSLPWLDGRLAIDEKITSVFPSTTVAALSSVWTGHAPAQHGFTGFLQFLPEQAVLGQMIHFTPLTVFVPDALVAAGLDPATFLQAPGFGEQLAAAGIPSYSVRPYQYARSVLSQMHDRGVTCSVGVLSAADLFAHIRELLEQTAGRPLYAHAYWPDLDSICHAYGPDHPAAEAEIRTVFEALRREVLDALSPAARRDTVLFVTGDHGQIVAPEQQFVLLDDHPVLKELLLMRPSGEPRTPYLYARQGRKDDVLAYFAAELGAAAVAFDSGAVLAAGLLGPQPHAPVAAERVGDVVATMRHDALLLTEGDYARRERLIGRHGGLTAPEMEVPWLGFMLS